MQGKSRHSSGKKLYELGTVVIDNCGCMGDASMEEGRTVLYVSHNMNTIKQFCTRCIVIDQGQIIYDGDVDTAIGIYMETSTQVSQVAFDISV